MKRFQIFITILLSSVGEIYSCGYYLHGEDIRYSLFLPEYFEYYDFNSFNYSANLFGFDSDGRNQIESNVFDWFNYTNQKVPIESISYCLNALKITDINSSSENQFVQYLLKNKLTNIIKYLIIAKECESYNSLENIYQWERTDAIKLNYPKFLNKLTNIIDHEKSDYLKRKYAFLTIRTAYYGGNHSLIKTLFKKHFTKNNKDYLYYWALYFYSFKNNNASIDIADIMVNSQEKKYACFYYFHETFELKTALLQGKTQSEIANLYTFASIQRLEPNLDYLKKIYENSSKLRVLDFLLLREINKIEDWIYTPYYTNYSPSIEFAIDRQGANFNTETLRARSEKDRLYAQRVLNFISTVDTSRIKGVSLWKAAEIQLLFMTRNYFGCLSKINDFEAKYANEKIITQIEKIKALCIISNQPVGKAIIKDEAKPIIMKYLNDKHFLFSIGRELEFRKNLPDALAIMAYLEYNVTVNYYEYGGSSINWEGNRLNTSGNMKYFSTYSDYVDFVYSADELQIVVNKLNITINDDFNKTIYSQLLKDKNYLTDLLGTKYIREDRLLSAEKTFKSLSQNYWAENYNLWERDRYEDYYAFDKNPFYDIKYTNSFIPNEDKFIVTKLSVTQHLVKYLALANSTKTTNRDYYYFIVATCYLNMTQYGHSWMMRRYSSTSDYNVGNDESYIDEIEYRTGRLAQKYYHLAFANAKTDHFKALCLRMEDYAKDNINSEYEKLKTNYPKYYEDLSNCENLVEYFKDKR
jgi:hypothetical protein